jgi:hypothetical protein
VGLTVSFLPLRRLRAPRGAWGGGFGAKGRLALVRIDVS